MFSFFLFPCIFDLFSQPVCLLWEDLPTPSELHQTLLCFMLRFVLNFPIPHNRQDHVLGASDKTWAVWWIVRLHYISPSNLRSLLLLLSLQLRDLCPYASIRGLIRPSTPRSWRNQSDRYFLNMVNPRAYF